MTITLSARKKPNWQDDANDNMKVENITETYSQLQLKAEKINISHSLSLPLSPQK